MRMTFIRHGKTLGNIEHRYVGRSDEPLSDEGIRDIKNRIETYSYLNDTDVIFVSPMRRCIQTAELIFEQLGLDIDKRGFIVVDGFREYDFGDFEGKNHDDLMKNKMYRDWLDSNGSYDMPAGEGLDNFKSRVIAAFDETVKICYEQKYNHTAYIVHGGTIMAVFSEYDSEKKAYYDYKCKNGEGYRCHFNGNMLERMNR